MIWPVTLASPLFIPSVMEKGATAHKHLQPPPTPQTESPRLAFPASETLATLTTSSLGPRQAPEFLNELLHLAPPPALPRGPHVIIGKENFLLSIESTSEQKHRDTTTQQPPSQEMTGVGFPLADVK